MREASSINIKGRKTKGERNWNEWTDTKSKSKARPMQSPSRNATNEKSETNNGEKTGTVELDISKCIPCNLYIYMLTEQKTNASGFRLAGFIDKEQIL